MNGSNGNAVTIVLEDDEDDVRVFSPQSLTQRSALQGSSYVRSRPVHIPVLDDDDLELRLGPSGVGPAVARSELAGRRARPELTVRLSVSNFRDTYFFSSPIDLTHANDDIEVNHRIDRNQLFARQKRKQCQPPLESPWEIKLNCVICMDTMEEETSTVCGHIFCRKCIVEAIKMQKKCPTCRKGLMNSQIHRIYLS